MYHETHFYVEARRFAQYALHLLRDGLPLRGRPNNRAVGGLTTGMGLKNVFLRRDQFARAEDEVFCLAIARDIVATKIRNQRTLLQRNHIEPPALALSRLKQLADSAQDAGALESLLGIEGTAARLYFEQFAGMLKAEDDADRPGFDFTTRNRRPPKDPVNALLSLGYAMLTRDLTFVCHAIGFDPFMGFYHQPRFGRPALALDLMEGFRPLVVDSSVLTAVNARMVTADDFVRAGDALALSPRGRKGFIRAYEQRMDTLVTHPLFSSVPRRTDETEQVHRRADPGDRQGRRSRPEGRDLCRANGITDQTYYRWKAKYGGMELSDFSYST
jgi:CRISPR-associated endonuclease Cas1